MSKHDLMQVAETIGALGLIGNEDTDEMAIGLTALAKLAVRFPDLSLVELNKAIAIAFDGGKPRIGMAGVGEVEALYKHDKTLADVAMVITPRNVPCGGSFRKPNGRAAQYPREKTGRLNRPA
jgi:hypothetical protein